jgi:uncharacterized damage-inducible protein DinB
LSYIRICLKGESALLPPFVRKYLLAALSGTPDVLDRLIKNILADDPIWDERFDPERFTLREVLAHLADWETVFFERMSRICREDNPELPNCDEGQVAIDHDYAHTDPRDSLATIRAGRERMVAFLREREPSDWQRAGHYLSDIPANSGPVTLEAWLAQVAGHDGYHTQQVAQYLALGKR